MTSGSARPATAPSGAEKGQGGRSLPVSKLPNWRMLLLILATAVVLVFLGYPLDRSGGGGTEPTVPPTGAGTPR